MSTECDREAPEGEAMTRNRVMCHGGGGGGRTGSVNHLPSSSVGTGTLAPAVKRPGRESDHLPPFIAEVKNKRKHTPFTPLYAFVAKEDINPLNPELNPICYLLALLAHLFLHVNRIRVKSLTFRLLMSYIYIYDIWSTYS